MIFLRYIKSFFILTAIVCTSLASCKKTGGTMIVIKDCTGQYLRFNELDYRICNTDCVSGFDSGTVVDAKFKEADSRCKDRDEAHCMMVHPYPIGDWIKITKIQ